MKINICDDLLWKDFLMTESENKGMSEISEVEIKAMSKEQNYLRGYSDGKSDTLDKIRAEIEQKIIKRPYMDFKTWEREHNDTILEVLDIIDKYRESEDME